MALIVMVFAVCVELARLTKSGGRSLSMKLTRSDEYRPTLGSEGFLTQETAIEPSLSLSPPSQLEQFTHITTAFDTEGSLVDGQFKTLHTSKPHTKESAIEVIVWELITRRRRDRKMLVTILEFVHSAEWKRSNE